MTSHLRILLNTLHGLLLRLATPARKLGLQSFRLLLLKLPGIGAVDIMLHGLGTDIAALAVLLHGKVCLRLAQVGTDELGIFLDRCVAILHGPWERHQFDERGSPVGVASRIFGGALDHLSVSFHSAGPVCVFEFLPAKLPCFLSFFGVDVTFFLGFDLRFLCRAQLVENVWSAVLGE